MNCCCNVFLKTICFKNTTAVNKIKEIFKELIAKMALIESAINPINKVFEKCGEITTAIQVGKQRLFALNCIFCATICIKLEKFALHIEQQHGELLCDNIETTEELDVTISVAEMDEDENIKEVLAEQNECKTNIALLNETTRESQTNENYVQNSVECKFTNSAKATELEFDDPLEEIALKDEYLEQHMVKEELHITDVDSGSENDADTDPNAADDDSINNNDDDDNFENSQDGACESSDMDSNSDSEEALNDSFNAIDKDLILATIAGYEKHRLLWDANDAMAKNRKKREEAFKRIATSINKQLNRNIKWKTISAYIKKLRYKFRTELQNQKQSETTTYTPLWYYDKLQFLNTSIKYKQRNKRGAKALANEKPALPLSNLSDAQNLELIAIYKSFPCLWDVQHIGFRFKNQRQEAADEMLQAIKNKMNLSFNSDVLQKKLYRIRYACTQEKHRKLQCEQNREVFKPSCRYYDEISFLLDNVGPFKCPFCEQTFNGADQYRIHKSKHDGSMPFTCPLCKRGFMKVGNCTVHLRRHTRDYPFECKVCGKRYATSTDINVHMRYHTGEKPYFCEVCGQSFRTWTFFDAHMRRHQKRPNHKCSICSKTFYEKNKLNEHMKAHLNVRDKVCNVCGKAFTSSKYLRQHKQIHAEKKKYVCKICNKDFAQYAGLSGHMKSHGTTVSGAIEEQH